MVQGDGTIWKNRVHPLNFLPKSAPGEDKNVVACFTFYYTSPGKLCKYTTFFLVTRWLQNESTDLLPEEVNLYAPNLSLMTTFVFWMGLLPGLVAR